MRKTNHLIRLAVMCLFFACALTGCGRSSADSTSGNNNTDKNDLSDNVSNAANELADGAADTTKDIAQGIGDATDDLLGSGGFDNYNDAHDYFLDTMGAYHSDAKFELRNEDKSLADYQEGSKGYHFYLYDTSKNTSGDRFGEFYVDATSGRIYRKNANNTIEEYPAASTQVSSRSGSTSRNTFSAR